MPHRVYPVSYTHLDVYKRQISLRTNPNYLNATATCARLGGGGHVAASGCTVRGTVDEAETAFLEAIYAQLAEQARTGLRPAAGDSGGD